MEDQHLMPPAPSVDGMLVDKVTILPGATHSAATFCILEEDHTLGNVLRWMIMKDPTVEFCGYSAPHPSEMKIHLRIQMLDDLSAKECLDRALGNLEDLVLCISSKYDAALAEGDYARPEEEPMDFESLNNKLWAARGEGAREAWEEEKRRKEEEEKKELEGGKKKSKKATTTGASGVRVGR